MAVQHPQPVVAIPVEMQSEDESGEVVAAMPDKKRPTNKHYKGQQNKQTASSKAGRVKFICFTHARYGEDAFDCADKKNCTWSGN